MTNKKTISGMMGKGSMSHNKRTFIANNVDAERTCENVTIVDEDIRDAYRELFDDALERFNEKQTRNDRKIPDYYEHIRCGKQEKLFHEVIFQIGNMDDTSATGKDAPKAKEMLEEFTDSFIKNNPNLKVIGAYIHMDEATPHVHIDFVPFVTESRRGLDTRNTLKGALAAMGYSGTGKRDTEWNHFMEAQKATLAAIMESHGLEWLQKGTHEEHLDVYDFKVKMRKEELEELSAEVEAAIGKIDIIESQVSDRQNDVEELDKEISNKKKTVKGLDEDIDKKGRSLEEINKKKLSINKLDGITTTAVPFDKLLITKEDFNYLLSCAKKYITVAKEKIGIKALKEELEQKNNEIAALNKTVKQLNDKLEGRTSLKDRMDEAGAKVKLDASEKENSKLKNLLIRLGFKKEMEAELGSTPRSKSHEIGG